MRSFHKPIEIHEIHAPIWSCELWCPDIFGIEGGGDRFHLDEKDGATEVTVNAVLKDSIW